MPGVRRFTPGSIPYFLSSQFYHSNFAVPHGSFEGKTIIVTGSNVGLGYEAAKHFARLGAAKLILAVRSVEKGEKARKQIEAETDLRQGIVETWQLDLGSYDSVKKFAARASQELDRVDVLCENAGIAAATYRQFEGEESTITTNVISTFLLAFLMLPKLKETASRFSTRPVLTIVSSEVHHWSAFKEPRQAAEGQIFEDLSDPKKANMGDRYPLSKLLEVFIIRQMAALRPTRASSSAAADPARDCPITINTVNPGFCHSELAREAGALSPVTLMKMFLARTTEVGSRTLVHAAGCGPDTHGQYLSDCDIEPPSKLVRSDEGEKLQGRIYNELTKKLEKIAPGCTSNL